MEDKTPPVPVSPAQWPEARGFRRVYSGNPEYQARFVMALFGFRQDVMEWTRDEETANAVGKVILAFHAQHPEFMQDGFVPDGDIGTGPYSMDQRLNAYMAELTGAAVDDTSKE